MKTPCNRLLRGLYASALLAIGSVCVAQTPLIHYNFNAGTGVNALDRGSGLAANGTLQGAAAWSYDTPSGSGYALDITPGALANHVQATTAKLGGLSKVTVTLWVNLAAPPNDLDRIVSNVIGTSGLDVGIGGTSASNFTLMLGINGAHRFSNGVSADKKWAFLAVSYDGTLTTSNVKFYSGGEHATAVLNRTQDCASGALTAPAGGLLMVGSTPATSANRTPPALIDDVRIYNSILSLAQIQAVQEANLPTTAYSALDEPATTHVIFPRDYGAIPDDTASDSSGIAQALAAAQAYITSSGNPCEVRLEPGRYLINPQTGVSGYRVFQLTEAHDLVINGNGAEFVITDPRFGLFYVTRSSRVVIKNLTIDYNPLPFSAGYVRAVQTSLNAIDLEVVGSHPSLAAAYFSAPGLGYLLHPTVPGRLRDNSYNVYLTDHIESLPNGYFRIFMRSSVTSAQLADINVGDKYAQLCRQSGSDLFFASHSNDITFRDITSYASSSALYTAPNTYHLNLIRCESLIKTGRWKGGNADGVHVQGARVGPRVENCRFEGLGDDGLNVYLRPIRASSVVSSTELVLTVVYPGEVKAGDYLQFFNPVTGSVTSVRRVVSFNETTRHVVLDGAVGTITVGGTSTSCQIYRRDSTQRLAIISSQFMNLRRYGNKIAANGLIQGNSYLGVSNAAIDVANDPGWPEGLFCSTLNIRDNIINNCGFDREYAGKSSAAAITVAAMQNGGMINARDLHGRIEISGNVFSVWRKKAIWLRSGADMEVSDNHFDAPVSLTGATVITAGYCTSASGSGNTYGGTIPSGSRVIDAGNNISLTINP